MSKQTPKKFQPPQYGARSVAKALALGASYTPVNKTNVLDDLTMLAEQLGVRYTPDMVEALGPRLVLDLPRDFNADMLKAITVKHDPVRGVIVSLDCGKLIGPWRKLLATTIRGGLLDPRLLGNDLEVAARIVLGWIGADYGIKLAHMRYVSNIREQHINLYIPGEPPQDAVDELLAVGKLLGGVEASATQIKGNTAIKKLPLSAARHAQIKERVARIMEGMQPPAAVKSLEAAFLQGYTIEFHASVDQPTREGE